MIRTLLILILLSIPSLIFSQNLEYYDDETKKETHEEYADSTLKANQEITINRIGKYRTAFSINGRGLDIEELKSVMISNPEALTYYENGITNNNIAGIIAYIGGFGIGWFGLGPLLRGAEPNYEMLAVSSLVSLACIPFSISTNKNFIRAAEVYNEGVRKDNQRTSYLQVGFTQYGAGLQFTF